MFWDRRIARFLYGCEVYATKEDRWGNIRKHIPRRSLDARLNCFVGCEGECIVPVAADLDRLSKPKRIGR